MTHLLALPLTVVVFCLVSALMPSSLTAQQSTRSPELFIEKAGYLAGDAVPIFGEGFSPFERITLRVTHDGNLAEPGAGHAAFSITADAGGAFEAKWAIDGKEAVSRHFVATAVGTSGASAAAEFTRIGALAMYGRVNTASGKASVHGAGFNANEPVAIDIDNGRAHSPLIVLSDADGGFSVDLDLPRDNPDATAFAINAEGQQSRVKAGLSASEYEIFARDPNGVPTLETIRAERALSSIGLLETGPGYDLALSWGSEGASTTRSACVLFAAEDMAKSGRSAVCAQIAAGNGGSAAVTQTAASPYLVTCTGVRADRCSNPVTKSDATRWQSGLRSGSLNDLNGGVGRSHDGVLTLRVSVDKRLLAAGARPVSACSYGDSVVQADAEPLECIAITRRDASSPPPLGVAPTNLLIPPLLTGQVVFHRYASYNDGSGQLFLANLTFGTLTNLSETWTNLKDPINPSWAPDGLKITFMARPKKGSGYSAYYDVFLYIVGQTGNPVNLTRTGSKHDEDPKFSGDGRSIVYKIRPSTLAEIDLTGAVRKTIIDGPGVERSMPYYDAMATAVWYSHRPMTESNAASSIHFVDTNGRSDVQLVDTPGVVDFYPIRDTIGHFLYSRTVSAANLYGQVYVYNGAGVAPLPFNTPDADYSDAVPAGAQYIVLSSTKAGGSGGYDLYIADRFTGAMWPLSSYVPGVNSSREELGAAYAPF